MTQRMAREPVGAAFGARRLWRAIVVTVLIGGFWTAMGLASSATRPPGARPASLRAPSQEAEAEGPTRSVWDGVYTEDQARRGRPVFQTQCADCHKPSEFKTGYPTAYAIFSSRSDMPESAPGSLSAQDYADLIAYVFEANDMPAGKEELKGEPEILKRIRIEAEKPAGR